MASPFVSLVILSTPYFGASLKVEVDQAKSPTLEAIDGLSNTNSGSSLVSNGMASLASVINKIGELRVDDSLPVFKEGETSHAAAELRSISVPTVPKKDAANAIKSPVAAESVAAEAIKNAVAAEAVAAEAIKNAVAAEAVAAEAIKNPVVAEPVTTSVQKGEETTVAARKQVARGRGAQSLLKSAGPSWIAWFNQIPQQSSTEAIGLFFLFVGALVGSYAWAILQSRCSPKEDSVLEEAWKPKQEVLPAAVQNPLKTLANDTVATVAAVVDAASKLVEGQPAEPPKESQPNDARKYVRRNVSCAWPKEEEEEEEEAPEWTRKQERPKEPAKPQGLLSCTPTVAKVELDDELGAWIPHIKDVAAELQYAHMAESWSQEDSTSAGDSEQSLLDKLREVASDGEDEAVSPRHYKIRRWDSTESNDRTVVTDQI